MILDLVFTSIILTNIVAIGSFICSISINTCSKYLKYLNYYIFDSVSDPINTKNILKQIKDNGGFISKYIIDDGKQEPDGLCFNIKHKYLVYIENWTTSNQYTSKKNSKVYVIGKCPIDIKSISNLDDSGDDIGENTKVLKLYLSSAFYDGQFKQINLPFNNFEPLSHQTDTINKIVDSYEKNIFHICRTLVYGEPRKGKSFIGKLLASKYDSAYCFDIKLDSPGTQLLTLWETFKPEKDRPLIVQIDEFDILIKNIHEQNIKHEHDWLKTMVYDKQSYNTFISEYLICLPYVIYLFTMNSKPEDINKMDESFIRTNRIDLLCEM